MASYFIIRPFALIQDEQRAMLEQEQRHAEMARLRQQEQAAAAAVQHQAKLAPWAKKPSSAGSAGAAGAATASSGAAAAEEENGGGRSLAEIQRLEQEEKRRRDAEDAEERRRFAQQVDKPTTQPKDAIVCNKGLPKLLRSCKRDWPLKVGTLSSAVISNILEF